MSAGRPTVNYRQNAFIARMVGVLAIALGFVCGVYGLDHPGSRWLATALGLLVTGTVAQAYALYCAARRAAEAPGKSQEPPNH